MARPDANADAATSQALLRAVNLGKSFGPVRVLDGISLEVHAGEVHAIIGENGAGKSTLMKLLAGNEQPTEGHIDVDGKPVALTDPTLAEALGIVLVHQEILLAPDLTVAQNIYLGRELTRRGVVDDAAMRAGAKQILHELGAEIDPDATVARLSIAQRQLVQIARVLLVPHRLVIFDEPTASLTPVETRALLTLIAHLRTRGVGVLYISHRLPEVKEISDRVTVLRDGKLVGSHATDALQPADMARLMVGRDVAKFYPDHEKQHDPTIVLQVKDFSVPGDVHSASFHLRKGEILGFAGLVGAGRSELMEGVVGLRKAHGEVLHHGNRVQFGNRHDSARDSLQAGIVYLSEDRKGKGLLLQKDMVINLTLATLERFSRHFQIDRGREQTALDKAIADFDIRTGRKDILAGQLSGGNQQKLLLAKMLLLEPSIVIIDEPTRGIDVGTKEQIYQLIIQLAAEGKSIIVVSSEMPELLGICDRIIVMREGYIAGEVSGAHMNEHEIVALATGVDIRAAA